MRKREGIGSWHLEPAIFSLKDIRVNNFWAFKKKVASTFPVALRLELDDFLQYILQWNPGYWAQDQVKQIGANLPAWVQNQ